MLVTLKGKPFRVCDKGEFFARKFIGTGRLRGDAFFR